MDKEKDKKLDSSNTFNLSDDLNKIIAKKVEENEANNIENAINSEPDSQQVNEIASQINEQINAQLNSQEPTSDQAPKNEPKPESDGQKGGSEEEEKKKKKNIIIIILIILLIVLASISLGKFIFDKVNANKDSDELSQIVETTLAPVTVEENLIQNPYDFADLQSKNEDIYAWITVPNTKVDYPIVQNPNEDNFYLKRSALTKEWQSSGAIYTQRINSKDFNDPLTVVYGHNGYKDTMFTTLHKFEKKEFFDQNEFFYIYTNGSKLTYQIVSAFKFDDRHLMYAYKMQDLNSRQSFMDMIQNPESQNKNVRDIGRKLNIDDKICVLSTCITNQKSNRYLVCGVLVNNEKTN